MSLVTKNIIVSAYFELMQKKSIDKITVKDIVEKCNITRQTFYYHFQDTMDLIEWFIKQKMDEILRKSLETDSVEEAVRLLITPVENNSNIIMKLLNSQRRDETLRLLISTINTYMVNMVERKSLFMDMKRSDLDMTLNFFTFAMVRILLDIAYKQKPVDYDLIAHQIYLLVTGQMVKPGELQ